MQCSYHESLSGDLYPWKRILSVTFKKVIYVDQRNAYNHFNLVMYFRISITYRMTYDLSI